MKSISEKIIVIYSCYSKALKIGQSWQTKLVRSR